MANEYADRGVANFQVVDARDERASGGVTGLESNPDSCYDSDSSSGGSRCNGAGMSDGVGDEHSDISRTTSDTLAAECSESDTPKCDVVTAAPSDLMSNAEYAAKVEFGLRLGYTEDQILKALDKVGYQISEDELLAELIKIGDVTADSDDDSEDSLGDVNVKLDRTSVNGTDSDPDELRPIVIDGSNVAMRTKPSQLIPVTVRVSCQYYGDCAYWITDPAALNWFPKQTRNCHGNNVVFSCAGIKLAVDWFRDRGHKEITVFVPNWRKEASCPVTPITDQDILLELERKKVVVFTPARRVAGKRVICYDDRYVMKLAAESGGIVVSNDNYRDLIDENPDYKRVVEERLLMYSFVNDRFMPPDDPLGRYGPNLNDFLRKYPGGSKNLPPACPYGKKCTYGNKCKYYHPERGQQPVKLINEKLIEKACKKIKEVKEKGHLGSNEKKTKKNADKPAKKLPLTQTKSQVSVPQKKPLTRTRSLQPNPSVGHSKPKPLSDFLWPESTKSNKDGKDTLATDSQNDNYQRYNNKLSELRLRVEDAEASEKHGQTLKEGIPKKESDRKQDVVKEKKPMSSWAIQSHDLLTEFGVAQTSFTNGHLALAKKLSDEGKSCDNLRNSSPGFSPVTVDRGQMSTEGQGQQVRGHMALQRQLSLKGYDDPRLSHGLNASRGMSAVQAEENQRHLWPAQSSQSHWSEGHSLLAKRASCPLVTMASHSREASPHPAITVEQRISQRSNPSDHHSPMPQGKVPSYGKNTLSAQQPTGEHLPLHRLKSDPLVPQNDAHNRGLVTKFAEISRQNSSSDPQLSVHQDEQNWCPPTITLDNDASDVAGGYFHQNVLGIPLHIQTAPNSPHVPMSPHFGQDSFTFRHHVGALQMKEMHGSYPDVYCSANLAKVPEHSITSLQSNAGGQTMASHQTANHLPSEVNTNTTFFVSSQSEHPPIMMPRLVHDVSKPPSAYIPLSYQSSVPQQAMPQIRTRMSTPLDRHTVIATNVPMLVQDSPVMHNVNIANTQQSGASGSTQEVFLKSSQPEPRIGEMETRYKLYYHLCALFKEEDVQRVMLEHPNETNPQVLCKHLVSL